MLLLSLLLLLLLLLLILLLLLLLLLLLFLLLLLLLLLLSLLPLMLLFVLLVITVDFVAHHSSSSSSLYPLIFLFPSSLPPFPSSYLFSPAIPFSLFRVFFSSRDYRGRNSDARPLTSFSFSHINCGLKNFLHL